MLLNQYFNMDCITDNEHIHFDVHFKSHLYSVCLFGSRFGEAQVLALLLTLPAVNSALLIRSTELIIIFSFSTGAENV